MMKIRLWQTKEDNVDKLSQQVNELIHKESVSNLFTDPSVNIREIVLDDKDVNVAIAGNLTEDQLEEVKVLISSTLNQFLDLKKNQGNP